ncbi:TetR/AcrR family transcriptional regulator [Methylopila henanensis]|uniref:TetR/AcrR family transcriptional regulator n=1 Tax=Methylopila henanensis TaxID=873516 RepID=A0ABW4K507_9HYPH
MSPVIGPRARRQQDQRRRILDAAVTCFAQGGFHATGMQAICAEAGMSPGALYRYFPSKEAIIEAIVERDRAEAPAMLAPLLEADDVVGALVQAGRNFLTGNLQTGGMPIFIELCAEAARNPQVNAITQRCEGEIHDLLVRVIQRGQTLGQIDPALDAAAAVRLLSSLADGLLLRMGLEGIAGVDDLLGMFERAVRSFLAAPARSER